MSDEKLTPFTLSCGSCGAPMHFDIVEQNYCCNYCHGTEFSHTRKAYIQQWARENNARLQANSTELKRYECPNCGNDVNTLGDSQSLSCFSCGSSMVTADFAATDDYPVGIVAFSITLTEAKTLVEAELSASLKHLSKTHKAKIRDNLDSLRAVYLPFQLFTGPIDAEVSRYGKYNQRVFHLKSYVNQKVVIACDNVDNDLIERIEPYNLDNLQTFEFLYISGHQAKTQDIGYQQLEQNFNEELQDDIKQALGQTFGSASLNIVATPHDECSVPVLLPVFTLTIDGAVLTINGQTGKIAVKDAKKKASRKWLLAPTVASLCIATFFLYFGEINAENFDVAIPIVFVMTLLVFIIFSKIHRQAWYNPFFASKQTYSRQGRKLAQIGMNAKPTFAEPVFYEQVNGKSQAVEITFYPLHVRLALFLSLLTWLFLFELIDWIFPSVVSEGFRDYWGMFWIFGAILAYFIYKQILYDRVYYRPYKSRDFYRYLKGSFSLCDAITSSRKVLFDVLKLFVFGAAIAYVLGTGLMQVQKRLLLQYYASQVKTLVATAKQSMGLDKSYQIDKQSLDDFDGDGNKDAIVFIKKAGRPSHVLFFDLTDKRLKDSLALENQFVSEAALTFINAKSPADLHITYQKNDDSQGFALYRTTNGKFDSIINIKPQHQNDVMMLVASDTNDHQAVRQRYGFDVFGWYLQIHYSIKAGQLHTQRAELTINDDAGNVVASDARNEQPNPVQAVRRYIQLSWINKMFIKDKIVVNGLSEYRQSVAAIDFDKDYLWAYDLVRLTAVDKTPRIAFTSTINGKQSTVTTHIVGRYAKPYVTSAGIGKLINYDLEKIDGQWKIVKQYAVQGDWRR